MINNEHNSLTNLDEYISLKGRLISLNRRLEYEKNIESLILEQPEALGNEQNELYKYTQQKNKLELERLGRAIERYTSLTENRKNSITPREIEQSVLNDFLRHRKEQEKNEIYNKYSIMVWEEKFFVISDGTLREALSSFIKSVEEAKQN